MDENENKNEIAAILFSIFTGLSVLLLAGWWMNSSRSGALSPAVGSAVIPAAGALSIPAMPGESDRPEPSAALPAEDAERPAGPIGTETGSPVAPAPSPSSVPPLPAHQDELSPEARGALEAKLNARADARNASAELDKLRDERDSYKIAAETAKDRLAGWADLENRAAKLEADLKAAVLSRAELQTKLDEAANARKDLAAKLEAKTTDSDKVQEANFNKIKGLEDQVAALKTELEANKKAMASSEGSLKQNLARVLAEANQHKTRIAEIEKLNLGLNQSVNDFKTQKNQLEAKIASLDKEKTEMSKTMETLKAEAQKKMAGAAEAVAAESRKLIDERDGLKAQLAALETTPQKMSNDFSVRIKILEAEKKALEERLARGQAMAAAPVSPEVTQLKEKNQSLASQVAKLTADAAAMNAVSAELNKLKEENKKLAASADQQKKLSAEIESLKSQVFSFKNTEKLKAAVSGPALDLPLLINDPASLDTRLMPLFAELRGIPDTLEAKTALYAEIAKRGKAAPVMQVKFTAGNSEVSEPDRIALRKLMEANPGSKFLVVGYASVDGDPKANYELSSRRASQVASHIAGESKNGQVQAVYYGQTRRFSPYDAPNRIVEVWKVNE